ncbi:MAG: SDH family Clp fold serine proteinase [Gammaproteobacteria bacterium]
MKEKRHLEYPGQPTHPLIEAVQKFAALRNRSAAIYLLPRNEPITALNVRKLADLVGDQIFDELDLVIRSSGGDIHAAYQLVCFLRSRAKGLIACVPRYARSAATLLCIGADLIVLDELAALGPLDTQVYAGFTDGGRPDYMSALNQFKNLERLRDFSLETLRTAAELLHDKKVGPIDEILKHALECMAATSTPLFSKVEAHKLGDYSQSLAVGEQYGRRLFRRFHDMDPAKIERIIRQLVHGYPSHDYVLDCHELQVLGFKAEVFTGEERTAARALWGHDSTGLIMLIDPDNPESAPAQVRHLQSSAPVNPWRTSVPRRSETPHPPEHQAWTSPPGPSMYDPPPWEDWTLEQEESASGEERDGETE